MIVHLIFDNLLVKQNIVSNRDFSKVHDWMDEYYLTKKTDLSGINSWISEAKGLIFEKGSSEDEAVLTDYLRVALGHLLLDVLWAKFVFRSDYEFTKFAFQRYMDIGYCNSTFKLPYECHLNVQPN